MLRYEAKQSNFRAMLLRTLLFPLRTKVHQVGSPSGLRLSSNLQLSDLHPMCSGLPSSPTSDNKLWLFRSPLLFRLIFIKCSLWLRLKNAQANLDYVLH